MVGLLDYNSADTPEELSAAAEGGLTTPGKLDVLKADIAQSNEQIAAVPFDLYTRFSGVPTNIGENLNAQAQFNQGLVDRSNTGNVYKTLAAGVGMVLNPTSLIPGVGAVGDLAEIGAKSLLDYGVSKGLTDIAVHPTITGAINEGTKFATQQIPLSVGANYDQARNTFKLGGIFSAEAADFGMGAAGKLVISSVPLARAIAGKLNGVDDMGPADTQGQPVPTPPTPSADAASSSGQGLDESMLSPTESAFLSKDPSLSLTQADAEAADGLINRILGSNVVSAKNGKTFISLLSDDDINNFKGVLSDSVERNQPIEPGLAQELFASSDNFNKVLSDGKTLPALNNLVSHLSNVQDTLDATVDKIGSLRVPKFLNTIKNYSGWSDAKFQRFAAKVEGKSGTAFMSRVIGDKAIEDLENQHENGPTGLSNRALSHLEELRELRQYHLNRNTIPKAIDTINKLNVIANSEPFRLDTFRKSYYLNRLMWQRAASYDATPLVEKETLGGDNLAIAKNPEAKYTLKPDQLETKVAEKEPITEGKPEESGEKPKENTEKPDLDKDDPTTPQIKDVLAKMQEFKEKAPIFRKLIDCVKNEVGL